MKKYIFKYIAVLVSICFTSCEGLLDVRNTTAIPDDMVWNDEVLLTAYVNQLYSDIYGEMDWNKSSASWSDEAGWGNSGQYGKNVAYGRITPDANELNYWPYESIRRANTYLQKIEKSSVSQKTKDQLTGEVYFIRAFQYFEMVKRFGGVPILKVPQERNEDLFVKRNSTSECFSFILEDIDKAISLLTENGLEIARFNKVSAVAFKSRILLYMASPQFNVSNDINKWKTAFESSKTAIELLDKNGYGLFTSGKDPYANLWFEEMNKEVIMVCRHNYPTNVTNRDAAVRPLTASVNASGSSQPTKELVDAFPMADGTPIEKSSEYDLQTFFKNRDPRFYSVVVYNGCEYPLIGRDYTTQYTHKGTNDGFGFSWGTNTGFYCRKAVDMTLTPALASQSGVDFIEMRYAEIMLNYAETANETGNTSIGYDMISKIRKRAGIPAGINNLYGLKDGMNKEEMRKAIQKERFIELCFENKRFWDLRRWRQLDELNNTRRHAIVPYLVDDTDISKGFIYKVENCDTEQDLTYTENYYFLPIVRSELYNNPNMEQTSGWENGTFDPLK